MKKKIGIITINDFNNYGNRLQCYAVQRYLEELGCSVENIYNEYSCDNIVVHNAKKAIRYLRNYNRRKNISSRKQNFYKFNKYIKFSEDCIINGKYSKDLNEKYDYFITGSDQVWNPLDSGRSEVDFLTFASNEKKISFSASIGVDFLPRDAEEKYRKYFEGYKCISVREDTAKIIVEKLTNRNDIEVLVDPTMLLSVEEWEMVLEKPNFTLPSRYILTYFLGGYESNEEYIKSIAKKYSCEIIDVYDRNSIFYTCGPQHFLYLVKNAFLICTDSFHSVVFSFLFHRPFIIFNREKTKINMNTRIDTFIEKFGLQQNKFVFDKDIDEYFHRDYRKGYQVLNQEREKAKRFFIRAFM